jgi:hypothetical protein
VNGTYGSQDICVAVQRCLHEISMKSQTPQRLAQVLYGPDKQPARDKNKARQQLSCIPQGAYGVVGFSRVKDERKGVFIADAVRRRADRTTTSANRPQIDCKKPANRPLCDCRCTAERLRYDRIQTARRLRKRAAE